MIRDITEHLLDEFLTTFFTVNYWNEISRLNLHIRPLSQLGKRGERRTNLMELMFSFSKETFPFISFII